MRLFLILHADTAKVRISLFGVALFSHIDLCGFTASLFREAVKNYLADFFC